MVKTVVPSTLLPVFSNGVLVSFCELIGTNGTRFFRLRVDQ